MKTRTFHINIILLLLSTLTGCQTTKEPNKEITAITLHIEATPDGTPFSTPVPIFRENPITVSVERTPFIDERDVANASVVEDTNGFSIALEFNAHGALMLESTTRANPGRRVAVKAEFGQTRWLAAPLLKRPLSNGEFIFTPDASRAEADRIVRGLTNAVAIIKKKETF